MGFERRTDPAEMMDAEDYALPAEIFIARRSGSNRSGLGYHRFPTATEAIEFAVAGYPSLRPDDLVMAVDDKRFNLGAIRTLHKALEKNRVSPAVAGRRARQRGPSAGVPMASK